MDLTKREQARQLAKDILALSRDILRVKLRFMDLALSKLDLVEALDYELATDGKGLYYDVDHVLRVYASEQETMARDYLHLVFHCVFSHSFNAVKLERKYWDTACDIAVEAAIGALGLAEVENKRQANQQDFLEGLKNELPVLTAEKIYRHLLKRTYSEEAFKSISRLFYADNHRLWYEPGNGQGGAGALKDEWEKISRKMEVDLETASKDWGTSKGSLTAGLKRATREKYDYASFLRHFAVRGETMKISEDEFDYVFYTYGLRLYKNMPLIEQLEYREDDRIKEFVIAIDTSESVLGETVQHFITKTYNILMQQESFFSKVNIHIIQCDTEVQEDFKITRPEEFEAYLATMKLKGFGGTDFRPVFDYVDALIENREFMNLKGLIYFTDGYGRFPERRPKYDTAFVFVNEADENPEVPVWAMKARFREEQ